MQEVCGEKSSQKTQIHKKIVNLHQNPKTRPEKCTPIAKTRPEKCVNSAETRPEKC
jgi:hypothetical protein